MKLVAFTVEKYRSITRAHKIKVGNKAILVGPNNEGKSNILRALVIAMNVFTMGRRSLGVRPPGGRPFWRQRHYEWSRDFPIQLQKDQPNGESVIILEFDLSDNERSEFWKKIKSNITGTLPLRISFSSKGEMKIRVLKQGKGGKALTAKQEEVCTFISEHIDFTHIPAIRTAESAQRIVEDMVERELSKVEDNPDYIKALERVAKIQEPVLDLLSKTIKDTLVKFLPAVSNVRVGISSEERYRAMRRSCEIEVDDGTPTLLEYKGDGVQSLAALAIMRHASERGASGKNLVVAIEEPESHLHPSAIHELRAVLNELSEKHQVVVTTHCPLFVDKMNISSNIIVNNQRAQPATKVEDIRNILGVRASDNLRHAELVLLVEGHEDKVAMKALLSHVSAKIKSAFDNQTLAIETLDGGTNLSYKASLITDALCLIHCFLDHDSCGKESFNKARIEGIMTDADVNFSTCEGMTEAEIEDLYDSNIYKKTVENIYGITLETAKFHSAKKWSDRMRDVFVQQGKDWNDRVKQELKNKVAEVVEHNTTVSLNENKRSSFDALVRAIETKLSQYSNRGHRKKANTL
jgi:putative ATP-dependent endonuclease of the OLD family